MMLFLVTLVVAVVAFDITTSNITNVASSPNSRFTVVRIVVSPKTSNVMASPNAISSASQHRLIAHKHKLDQRNISTSSIAIPYTNPVPFGVFTFKTAPTLDVYTQKKNTFTSSPTEPQAILETKTWVSIASDVVTIIYRLVDTLLTIFHIKIVLNILGGNTFFFILCNGKLTVDSVIQQAHAARLDRPLWYGQTPLHA